MFKKWLEKYYTPKEIGQIVITYKLLGIATFGTIWLGCYRYRPGMVIKNSPVFKKQLDNVIQKYPVVSDKILNTIKKTENWVNTSTYFKKFSYSIGAKPKKLVKSFIETIVIEKVCFVIILPIQVWSSIKIVKSGIYNKIGLTWIESLTNSNNSQTTTPPTTPTPTPTPTN
jgi:hypothetical protein